jgi:hypothetical protein
MCALLVIGFVWKVVRSKTASELLWYNRELAIQKDLQGSWELNVSELVSLAFFFRYWGLNSGPIPQATSLALFCEGFFRDRVS